MLLSADLIADDDVGGGGGGDGGGGGGSDASSDGYQDHRTLPIRMNRREGGESELAPTTRRTDTGYSTQLIGYSRYNSRVYGSKDTYSGQGWHSPLYGSTSCRPTYSTRKITVLPEMPYIRICKDYLAYDRVMRMMWLAYR
ncbi:hypothetical protein HZH66_005493 [Vespula vulgaris]|uniref:Uncharacterized protein n=1 Tax=Vespula vulgaris TaxID=7454 RepID=A0A834N9W1_VESVU|nr:hypothetical protein HZH66_005493 [Vespula vulgaris]